MCMRRQHRICRSRRHETFDEGLMKLDRPLHELGRTLRYAINGLAGRSAMLDWLRVDNCAGLEPSAAM